jgi:hypothetical protein
MTIDNAESIVAETERVLIAELTWAKLYIQMRCIKY